MDIKVCDTARHSFGKKRKELNCGALGSSDMERTGAEAAGRFGLRQQGGLNRGKGQREAGTDIREDVQCKPVQARDAGATYPVQVKPKAAWRVQAESQCERDT